MKWIGQNVYDFISRFRNDVYLESISSGTIASGGNLGLDSNNKIVKAAVADGDITGITITTDSGGGSAASDTSGSADFSILGSSGVGVTNSGTTITAVAVPAEIDHDSLNNYAANEHFTQANITTVGTIGTGVWQGTAIGSEYMTAATGSAQGAVELATTAETTTGTDANRAVTPDGLKDGYQGSTNVITVGSVTTGVWRGTAINQTYLAGQSGTNTGDETLASVNALDITEVGTIDSGVWQGTAIASAYLDADTAHYSATRQVTHHMITDDIDSDVIYISLGEIDSEGTSNTGKHLPLIAPTAGKLLKIFLRTSVDYSSETFTWKLYTRNVSASTGGGPSEIGAQSGAGPTNKTMVTYDFTSSLDSGTNAIAAGDKVQISIEAGDGATANGNYFITCMWEWDLS